MAWLTVLWRRLVFLARSGHFNADIEDQMQLHLELRAEALMHSGLTPEAARLEAARGFGNRLHLREDSRAVWGWSWLESVAQDARLASRTLRRHGLLSLVIVLTLGLGIALSTVVFSLIDAIEWRALPYPEPARLVILETMPAGAKRLQRASAAEFEEWRDHAKAFDGLAAWRSEFLAVDEHDGSGIPGQSVSCGFFDVLGAKPSHGRGFREADCRTGADLVAVITDGLWRAQFGGRPDIVGHHTAIDGRPATVVGVLPAAFRGFLDGSSARVWVPLPVTTGADRVEKNLGVLGRLRGQVSPSEASEQATLLLRRLLDGRDAESSAVVRTLDSMVSRGAGPAARVMTMAVCLVLLIACSNVASLLLARGFARRHELATRLVLGASRPRVVRQLLVETCVLAGLAGLVGVALASAALGVLGAAAHDLLAQSGVDKLVVDARAAGFALAVSLLTGLVSGLLPALKMSDIRLQGRLWEAAGGGRAVGRARSVLVSSQVALALVLVCAALLLLRSFLGCVEAAQSPGFRTGNTLTFVASLPETAGEGRRRAAMTDMLERIEALPGVTGAAIVNRLPLAENAPAVRVQQAGATADGWTAAYRVVSPGYLATMGLGLRAGRFLLTGDDETHPQVAVVNETLAKRLADGGAALGREVDVAGVRRTVVGVVADAGAIRAGEPVAAEVLVARAQQADEPTRMIVATALGPESLAGAIRSLHREAAPHKPSPEIRLMSDVLTGSLKGLGFVVALAGGFGVIAVALTLVGICGLVSYSAARRTREIGVRVALGASRRAILRLVVGQALARTLTGAAVGLAGAAAVSRVLPSRLFGLEPAPPVLFVAIAGAFLGTALVAALIPAVKALRVDPMAALRVE